MDFTDSLVSLGLGISFFLFSVIMLFLLYFVNAILLYKIGKNRNDEYTWIPFVPFINQFYVPYLIKDQTDKMFQGKFMLIYIASIVLTFIPYIGFMFAFVYLALAFYSFLILFRDYSDKYIAHSVILVLSFGLSYYISLFRFRNRKPKFIGLENNYDY